MNNEEKFIVKKFSINKRLLPLYTLLIYYFITLIVFKYGPTEWPVKNEILLFSYLIFAYLSLSIGYILGIKYKFSSLKKDKVLKYFPFFLFLFLTMLPLTSFGRTGSFLPVISLTSLDFGQAYYNSQNVRSSWVEYLRILTGPATFAVLPLGIIYFKKMKLGIKFLFITSIIYFLMIDISRGTNKSIADFILIFFITSLLIFVRNSITTKALELSKRNLIKGTSLIIFISISLFSFLQFFSLFIGSRTKSIYNSFSNTYLDLNNPFLKIVGNEELSYGLAMLMSYLTQGYYGLSLALEKPFVFTYGFGYSSFLLENIAELGFPYIKSESYPYRLFEDNWPTGQVWSSFFVWPASDITFLGVILLMVLIGYILGRSWMESLIYLNSSSIVVLCLMFILCFYLPLNNQLFQGGEPFIYTWFWLVLWLFGKKWLK
ncbi:hypothetical protein [Planococcus shenhongbingii]|uniref:Oligosaccharide repeat unit polymerase n=1 Tax=Planococcus shenhongbingii TaxID=3058398 RepID=A0ABT8N9X5_9BACL|nr:hypothetical protein [Planococcus sp. N017]MDN7244683.1 hypothetical protein [Planococcus sp. N017]